MARDAAGGVGGAGLGYNANSSSLLDSPPTEARMDAQLSEALDPTLSLDQRRGRALVMTLQYLGLFGHPQRLRSLATEWHVTRERARLITIQGRWLFLRQTGTIDDLPLSPRAKTILRDPPAPFSPIVTLEQFRTTLPHVADSELLKCPGIGQKTVTEIRKVWASYTSTRTDATSSQTSVDAPVEANGSRTNA